ncbi:MAG: efflux RND transporter periplasmic adaptor subunit, partial [Melioribacteraceae bacterium]|nr:efflux RND transporter periplasmic adaptor subunit [Melioribacteraceae bacterium]
SAENTSENNSEQLKNVVPVEAIEIKEQIIEQRLELTGILIPKNSTDIVAEVSGEIIKVNKELGAYVTTQETLAVIDDIIPKSQFEQAKAQVISSESNLEITESNLNSDKILFENGDISEFEYESAKLAYKNAEAQYLSAKATLSAAEKTFYDTRITSPIKGFISRKNIDLGTMVSIGRMIYRVVDLSSLKVSVSVPQEIVNRVRVGGKAIITISAINNRSFDGRVMRVSPQADEVTGGFALEIEVKNRDNQIKAGMTAKILLLLSMNEEVIAIPEYTVVTKNNENYVYKISDDIAELVKIDLGETVGENIIVNEGLSVGDKIVTVGMKNLGLRTRVLIEKNN